MANSWLNPILLLLTSLFLYLRKINRVLLHQPAEAIALSPHRWTRKEIEDAYDEYLEAPIDVKAYIPPKTGHRYIVVGGSGFLGM
jgi:hypothetical protein